MEKNKILNHVSWKKYRGDPLESTKNRLKWIFNYKVSKYKHHKTAYLHEVKHGCFIVQNIIQEYFTAGQDIHLMFAVK